MINVNDYVGLTDSDTIEQALANLDADRTLLITKRVSDIEPERDYWLIDRAILLEENTTVIVKDVKIKLSDRCRDNFFRSANCGLGIEDPEPISNISIKGEGTCVLEGADHPRASGDSSKTLHNPCPHRPEDIIKIRADWVPEERLNSGNLDFWDVHNHSYGTDAGVRGESQIGDWRGIGILFANVKYFTIDNITVRESHGWGISLEECSFGELTRITFDARMSKNIDGMLMNMENQDGIDLRNGCHHISISDISGETGDDMVALTAIVGDNETYLPGGSLYSTHVMPNDWTKRDRDIHDITVRNITGHSYLCWILRLLPANTCIYNVTVDGITDTAPDDNRPAGTVLLGDSGIYGTNRPDSMRNISISNVVCNSLTAITVGGYICDSAISNITNKNPDCETVRVERPDGMKNVAMGTVLPATKLPLEHYPAEAFVCLDGVFNGETA